MKTLDGDNATTRLLGLTSLKASIAVTTSSVECPVKGCQRRVERQRGRFKNEARFRCPEHGITISPSTFEYPSISGNVLNAGKAEMKLLQAVQGVKRECRMARDKSEDALTWNVFRFLEGRGLLTGWAEAMLGVRLVKPEVIYWSCLPTGPSPRAWAPLLDARVEFGEAGGFHAALKRGSEPDLVIVDDNNVVFIEAKLTASNKTPGGKGDAAVRAANPKSYISGGSGWFRSVFCADYATIVLDRKYELLRFWLIGTWIARSSGRRFHLANLGRARAERDIEAAFGRYIRSGDVGSFRRATWEDVWAFVASSGDPKRGQLARYLENKTVGYSGGRLRPAFHLLQGQSVE